MRDVPLVSIVDDDAGVREALADLFESSGMRICSFACARDFLEADVASRSHCIVSDIQMPGMSGIELSRQLRADAIQTPIILISAYASDPIRRSAEAIGVTCMLAKPFDPVELLTCVEAALSAG
ncbi:response regulator transcription factor [Sphingomonas azotifigens]|uniref:response regulator transcription factor n=1 Tax=Sphingomonas azotifigens TaxID=330920 RepID=UPI000A034D39|nr:response regulator [Sphingomonas azotifigens]